MQKKVPRGTSFYYIGADAAEAKRADTKIIETTIRKYQFCMLVIYTENVKQITHLQKVTNLLQNNHFCNDRLT